MSETVEGRATRRGRGWVVRVEKYGVYGHGRSLKAARDSTVEGLALVGVTADVTLVPETPELAALRAAEDAYLSALRDAVCALSLRRTSLRDIAEATGAPTKRVKQLLAESRKGTKPAPPDSDGRGAHHPAPGHPPINAAGTSAAGIWDGGTAAAAQVQDQPRQG